MIPWELIDSAQVPGNKGVLRLYRRGEEYSIRTAGVELMNSRVHGSEEALAEFACTKIASRTRPYILVGGLGMGYTMAAALKMLGASGRIVVAELVPKVVDWNRGPLEGLNGHALRDDRVRVVHADVCKILQKEIQAFDAILLDVDNGPGSVISSGNDWLYCGDGLDAAFTALRPEGVLAVWSAGRDRAFVWRLHQAGFAVDEVNVRARGRSKGRRNTIWLATRKPSRK
ncbi:MAG TPA: hypothetical protein ENN05_08445 [Deltaproteobacteria bacterium]|nr:hypothetical protein [Deltaproteobacteria bacterium]